MDDPATEADETGAVTANTSRSTDNADAIVTLDGNIVAEETARAANARMEADTALGVRIDTNWDAIAVNQTDIDANETAIAAETTARMEADTALGVRIDTNWDAIAVNQTDIDANETAISAEETARMAADTAEAEARMGADMMLATAIDDEATARMGADMMLATAIDDEATARMGADMMLATAIDDEATARMGADMICPQRSRKNRQSGRQQTWCWQRRLTATRRQLHRKPRTGWEQT
jgi:hypothetical protein